MATGKKDEGANGVEDKRERKRDKERRRIEKVGKAIVGETSARGKRRGE